ncbi:formate dehydrogenase [Rhizoctonia solani AG-1 IA]|uniref:Formate dehydrogenase n=1 Tax=Thanatephorus cucumeris (strain AG1-IA) TaxID=983506 RepID=L8WKJ4_THACA|nr:formate dehydrogenase [Rhizoctonia solani AG-1 IA]
MGYSGPSGEREGGCRTTKVVNYPHSHPRFIGSSSSYANFGIHDVIIPKLDSYEPRERRYFGILSMRCIFLNLTGTWSRTCTSTCGCARYMRKAKDHPGAFISRFACGRGRTRQLDRSAELANTRHQKGCQPRCLSSDITTWSIVLLPAPSLYRSLIFSSRGLSTTLFTRYMPSIPSFEFGNASSASWAFKSGGPLMGWNLRTRSVSRRNLQPINCGNWPCALSVWGNYWRPVMRIEYRTWVLWPLVVFGELDPSVLSLSSSTHLTSSSLFYYSATMKVLAVLYDGGKAAQEEPRLLGTTENKLGIADWLKDDKEGPDSVFQKELPEAEVLITTPFHPGYLTADLIKNKAHKLKLCITAGVGSDHVDLNAANEKKITVAEVSGSNVVSVAEHVIMDILLLVRNFVPAHEMIERGDWDVSQIARNAYDLEGKVVGTIGAGR